MRTSPTSYVRNARQMKFPTHDHVCRDAVIWFTSNSRDVGSRCTFVTLPHDARHPSASKV
jgi:hypothetical protein